METRDILLDKRAGQGEVEEVEEKESKKERRGEQA